VKAISRPLEKAAESKRDRRNLFTSHTPRCPSTSLPKWKNDGSPLPYIVETDQGVAYPATAHSPKIYYLNRPSKSFTSEEVTADKRRAGKHFNNEVHSVSTAIPCINVILPRANGQNSSIRFQRRDTFITMQHPGSLPGTGARFASKATCIAGVVLFLISLGASAALTERPSAKSRKRRICPKKTKQTTHLRGPLSPLNEGRTE
jgi:hypothetical protein